MMDKDDERIIFAAFALMGLVARGKSDATPFADVISQQAARIAELEKELEHTKGLCMLKNMQVKGLQQTKPLSDEEIIEEFNKLVDKRARAIEERILGK